MYILQTVTNKFKYYPLYIGPYIYPTKFGQKLHPSFVHYYHLMDFNCKWYVQNIYIYVRKSLQERFCTFWDPSLPLLLALLLCQRHLFLGDAVDVIRGMDRDLVGHCPLQFQLAMAT